MGKYTPLDDPRVDEGLERQVREIVDAIRVAHPATEAVFLVGGFGRGEGSAILQDGTAKALNDYDLLVLSQDDAGRASLRELSRRLAVGLGIDFVDIGLWPPAALADLRPTIFTYDLKHGAQVLFGDPGLLERIPCVTSNQLPPWEGVQLLLNRMAGLLGGFSLREGPLRLERRGAQYFRNQIVKVLMACGDALIVQKGAYTHRYAERREIVRLWGHEGKLDWLGPEAVARIIEGYDEKLAPGSATWTDDVALIVGFLPVLERVFLRCLSRFLGQEVACIDDGADRYLHHHRLGRFAGLISCVTPTAGVPLRHAVYACVPLVLFSLPLLDTRGTGPAERVHGLLRAIGRQENAPDGRVGNGWEGSRQACVRLWERHCHG